MTMTPEFTRGTRLHAADLNRVASEAASAHPGFSGFLAGGNGRELVMRSPRRQSSRGVPRGAAGQTDIAVIADVDAGTAGPRSASVYDPATMATRTETVCPAEIAGQFAVGDHSAAHVVAIRCPLATAGEDDEED